jgi:hypothetical protein
MAAFVGFKGDGAAQAGDADHLEGQDLMNFISAFPGGAGSPRAADAS